MIYATSPRELLASILWGTLLAVWIFVARVAYRALREREGDALRGIPTWYVMLVCALWPILTLPWSTRIAEWYGRRLERRQRELDRHLVEINREIERFDRARARRNASNNASNKETPPCA